MIALRKFFSVVLALVGLSHTPAQAAGDLDGWLEIEGRAVYSDRSIVDGDSIESTGVGASVDAGFEWKNGRTAVQFDLGASAFEFSDEDRDTRTGLRAVGQVSHAITPDVSITLAAGHWDDITTLEAREVDQDAVAIGVGYEDRPHRLRATAQYRERTYETAVPARGQGMRYDIDYTYRFGSWHWARLDLRAEDIDSENTRRGYERQIVRASFSKPLDPDRLWRLRPQIEWRSWKYEGRRVVDDPDRDLRKDSFVAPEIGVSYGKLDGLQARLRAAYQFRTSNDPRYRADAPYVDMRIGYRF